MGNMTKLLNKPLKAFAIYSLIVLLISIPVYFLVVDYIWLHELDEQNESVKERIDEKFQNNKIDEGELENTLSIWNSLQSGVKIEKINSPVEFPDKVYEITKINQYSDDDELERYRVLKSFIIINGKHYQITVETNIEDSDETFIAIAAVTGTFFIILLIGLILLNRRISKKSWQPFYKTLVSLKNFDLKKDKQLILEETRIEEFKELNSSLQKLVDENILAYKQQKSFIENASHELQTPIALLKSKLDLLLQEKSIHPELAKEINDIEIPLARLSRINKNMLLLAKVENQDFNEEEIGLKQFLESSLHLFEDYFLTKNICLETNLIDDLKIKANKYLIETLINNLISNAIRHTNDNGKIIVELNKNYMSVLNNGLVPLEIRSTF